MKTFTLILALVLCSVMVQAQITQPYLLSKFIYNGTSAYTTGKVIGGSPDSLDLWPAAPDSGGHGGFTQHPGKWVMLQSLSFADSLAQNPTMEMWVFGTRPAALSDGATFALSWADQQSVIAVIPFGTTYYAASPGSVDDEPQINRMIRAPYTSYKAGVAPRYWWIMWVIRSSKTWTVAKTLKINLQLFWQ